MKEKYPPIEPYRSGFLAVDPPHEIYWEESGNPEGIPVLFFHGGPGSGTSPNHRCYFDPKVYRIILFDQRGAGQSRPHACLEKNTTQDLIADVEALRQRLQIEKWLLFGGSWGSTLALAYGQAHPERALGFILRGIFLGRKKEIDWFYQEGAHRFFREEWDSFCAPIPPLQRNHMVQSYYQKLISKDLEVRKRAGAAWTRWEAVNLRLLFDQKTFEEFTASEKSDALARIECHYFLNGCFFSKDGELLEGVETVSHLPCTIVQGRYDLVCPFESAWELHRLWGDRSSLIAVPDGGHSGSEPGIVEALINATIEWSQRLRCR